MSETEDPLAGTPFEGMNVEEAQDVQELATLGHIEDTFEFCGTQFGLRTLRTDEDLALGIVLKEYKDSLNEAKAWATAHVGLALTHIDHDEAFCPQIQPSKTSFAVARMNYVSKFYFPVIAYLFERYSDLLERQNKAIEAAQGKS